MNSVSTPSIEKIVQEVRSNGLCVIPNAYSKQECESYKARFEKIIDRFISEKNPHLRRECQYIYNAFRHDLSLLDLISHPVSDAVLKTLLDEDYVLVSPGILNRKKRNDIPGTDGDKALGDDWHTDSRYLGGQRLDAGFGFLVVVMFDEFTKENGGTHYVPGSHRFRNIPERRGNYEYKVMEGEAGTMLIMDSGVWHRSGSSSEKNRWSMFNLYGPWFMKPYYRFYEMLGPEVGKKLTPTQRRLLHYNSVPPLHEGERMNTIVREV